MPDWTVQDIVAQMQAVAPLELAESWDNVGLLVGDRRQPVERLMTCLTLTPASVAEAIQRGAAMVVVHHPLPFRPLQTITTDAVVGRLLWQLAGQAIAVYSAHTAFDSAANGINQRLAAGLGLGSIEPLVPRQPTAAYAELGSGRHGTLSAASSFGTLVERVKSLLSIDQVRGIGEAGRKLGRVAIACGSGGSFLSAAHRRECDCLVTGEASFHNCLEAEALGMGLILTGHFASERFAMEQLAGELATRFAGLEVWASQQERDPLRPV